MKQSIFADSIVNISMAEGVVRFELVTLGAPAGEDKKIPMREVGSIATTLPGFIRMHEQMSKVMEELVKQGVIGKSKTESSNAGSGVLNSTDKA